MWSQIRFILPKIVPKTWASTVAVGLLLLCVNRIVAKPSAFVDTTVSTFVSERLCWSKESCKEEFQAAFTCRCPDWSYCRSPGRYYNAYCSIVKSGYIWAQQFNNSRTKM